MLAAHIKYPLNNIYSGPLVPPLFCALGAIGVDVFFVISGFVISLSSCEKEITFKEFVINRFFRVVPLYFLYTLPFLWIAHSSGGVNHNSFFNSFAFIPLIDQGNFTDPLHPFGWTLCFEIWFYLLFAILLLFFKPQKSCLFLSTFFLLALPLSTLFSGFTWYFPRFAIHPMCMEFAFGCFIYICCVSQNNSLKGMGLFISAILIMAFITTKHLDLAWHDNMLNDNMLGLERLAWWGVPAAMLVAGLVLMEKHFKLPNIKVFSYLGNISFSLYLVQPFIFDFFSKLQFYLSPISPVITACLIFAVAIFVATLSYEVLELRIIYKFKDAFKKLALPARS